MRIWYYPAPSRSRSRTYPFHCKSFVPGRGGGEKRGNAMSEFIYEESRMLSELSPRLIESGSECALSRGSHHRGLPESSNEEGICPRRSKASRSTLVRDASGRITNGVSDPGAENMESCKPSLLRSQSLNPVNPPRLPRSARARYCP